MLENDNDDFFCTSFGQIMGIEKGEDILNPLYGITLTMFFLGNTQPSKMDFMSNSPTEQLIAIGAHDSSPIS